MKLELTNVERQILYNQYLILSKIDVDNLDEYEYKMKILYEGYERDYTDVVNVFMNDSVTDYQTGEETSEILNMNRILQRTISNLSAEEKEKLDLKRIEFDGFDGNQDHHYSYANHMVESGKWAELRGKDLNSHTSSSLPRYRKMLPVFRQCLSDVHSIHDLNATHLKLIIDAVKK